jgi:hypothetical protein
MWKSERWTDVHCAEISEIVALANARSNPSWEITAVWWQLFIICQNQPFTNCINTHNKKKKY